jgi:hypothetical protein
VTPARPKSGLPAGWILFGLGLVGCGTDAGSPGDTNPRSIAEAGPAGDAAGPAPDGAVGPTFERLHLTGAEDVLAAVRGALPESDRIRFGGDAPAAAAPVSVEVDPTCAECFSLTVTPTAARLRGGAPLGLVHGLAELVEHAGFAVPHPLAPLLEPTGPFTLAPLDLRRDEPAIRLRGLHLHTLHPIEALDAYWLPGDAQLDRARAINRWTPLNGGNFVEWVALGDIQLDPERHAAWAAHTREVIADAHARGLKVGLGIQLFGQSNLQRAFDLIDDPDETSLTRAEQVGRALDLITPVSGLDFDLYNLSFGEFIGADPELFVDSVNLAYRELAARAPEAEMVTTIHVGDHEDLRVTYRGQEMLYYFLAQFADPAVVPWVHTVMFYNLYDPAGGAYHHVEFDEHRAFVEARLAEDRPVGYFPETAYWIAFDDSVPQFLPVYVTSRLLDLDRLRPQGALDAHVLFTTGWEWGYWLHDRAALRASYRGGTPEEHFAQAYGDARVGAALAAFGEAQRGELILRFAAPYTAGRDLYVDAGDMGGIIAAPDRLSLAEVAAAPEADRIAFEATILAALRALEAAARTALASTDACPGAEEPGLETLSACLDRAADADPRRNELRDGLLIDVLRPMFVEATYRAALAHAVEADPAPFVAVAEAAQALAQRVVDARHAALWDSGSPWLTERWANPTIYAFGYLYQPHTLCHWRRERNQLGRLLEGRAPADPNCAL